MERVTFAESLQRPNLDFVLPGLLAGTVGMIVGQGAIGKSYFALELGMSLVTGKPVAGGLWEAPKHGSCAICFGEDPAVIIRERKHWLMHYHGINNEGAAKIDDSLFTYSCVGDDMRIVEKTANGMVDGPFLQTIRNTAQGLRLLVLDPLLFLQGGEENDNNVAASLMQRLSAIARDTGCAIVVLHHVGKGGNQDGKEEWASARGASAFTTSVRWQLNMRPPSKEEQAKYEIDAEMRRFWIRTAVVKSNYGDAGGEKWLRRRDGGVLNCEQPVSGCRPSEKRKAMTVDVSEVRDDDF